MESDEGEKMPVVQEQDPQCGTAPVDKSESEHYTSGTVSTCLEHAETDDTANKVKATVQSIQETHSSKVQMALVDKLPGSRSVEPPKKYEHREQNMSTAVSSAATMDAGHVTCRGKSKWFTSGGISVSSQASVEREEGKDGLGSRPGSAKGRCHSHSPTSMLPQSLSFFSGNPSVETTEGIIHLFKDE